MASSSFLNDGNSKSTSIKRELLRLCIVHQSYSIADFSKALGISVPTITKLIGELMEDNFLQDEGKIGTSGGRRPSVYGLNPEAGYFVGVDVARHHFHIAISNFRGEIIKFIQDIEFVLEASEISFRTICRMVKDEVTRCGIPWTMVLGVGVSLSGRVNPEKGYSLTYFVSDDLPLKDIFQKEFNVPVNIENDSRAMAYGEYMCLGRKADKDMIFINISWGLGMGIIMDGKLFYGKSGYSGELGHFPALNNDIICRCGKVGCLETGASGSALHRMVVEKLRNGHSSSRHRLHRQGRRHARTRYRRSAECLQPRTGGHRRTPDSRKGLPAASHKDRRQQALPVPRVVRHFHSAFQTRQDGRVRRRLPALARQGPGTAVGVCPAICK